jgi:hypothetical protein
MNTRHLFSSIIALSFITIAASSAHALVEPNGTFIAEQCGVQTLSADAKSLVYIRTVCIGQVQGETKKSVQFRMADNSTKLYQVTNTADEMIALPSGRVQAMFHLQDLSGQKAAMNVQEEAGGVPVSIGGTLGNVRYLVPSLMQMVHIDSEM